MNSAESFRPAAVILTGGRSSRLGIGSKALASLAGQPMIQYVINALQPQTGALLLSVQQSSAELESFGLVNVPDIVQRHRGPLTGLYSAMVYLANSKGPEWLLLCPCDAPFIPPDLVSRLNDAVMTSDLPVSVAAYGQVVQPTFSLWNRSVLTSVGEAVMNEGKGGLMYMLDHIDHAVVEWPTAVKPPFFNINTPLELERAEELLDPDRPAA